jgi:hypothetical protein
MGVAALLYFPQKKSFLSMLELVEMHREIGDTAMKVEKL